MGSYLKGWRRKLSVVLLLLACAVMGLWIRNLADESDFCEILGAIVVSDEGVLRFDWDHYPDREHPLLTTGIIWVGEDARDNSSVWVSVRNFVPTVVTMIELGRVPHWLIVLPLTVLSSWLLISTPNTNPRQPVTYA